MSYELEAIWQAMKETQYNRTLNELTESIMTAKELSDALVVALNKVADASHSEAGTLWTYDRFGDGLIRPAAVYGGKNIADVTLRPGEGIAGTVIKHGIPCIIADCQKDERWAGKVDAHTGFKTLSMICVPLNWQRFTFGSIQLINRVDGIPFDDKDLLFVQHLAIQISNVFSARGLLDEYVSAELSALQTPIEAPDERPPFTTLFFTEYFEDIEESISKSELFASLSETNKKNVLRHAREIWRILPHT